MKHRVPSGRRPISYLVSTRMRPRLAASAWPKANRRAHIAAASSNSSAFSWPRARISSRDTDSSWAPFSAFVEGVKSGAASRWFLRIPSGRRCPQKVRSPCS